MENESVKSYACGWRNKVTGLIYYNTWTQTEGNMNDTRKERQVQTDFLRDKDTNVDREVGIQTNFFPDVRDRILPNSTKDTSFKEHLDEGILQSVVKIQRFYRAHRRKETANRSVSVSTSIKNATDWRQTETEEEEEEEPVCYRSKDFVILNRTSPKTKADFELLYNLLDRWRFSETKKARELLFEPSRIAYCGLILSKEVELLRAIDSMKTNVILKRKERFYRRFLDESSKPVVWKNREGKPIYVDTLQVQRAKRFREIYERLSTIDESIDERMKFLIDLRKDITTHTCKESDEVIRLMDQEIDFLKLNVNGNKLNWLRSGLRLAFLRLVKESMRYEYEKSSFIGKSQYGCEIFCKTCGRLIKVDYRRRSFVCSCCSHTRTKFSSTIVYEPYRKMLLDVRRDEAKRRCYTSFAFAVDAKIVYRLVNDIWHGKSAISENDCLEELRLVRFRNREEWSPWNCLLLTEREASLHRKVDEPEKFYGPMILQKFHTNNLQAKVQFASVNEFKTSPRS